MARVSRGGKSVSTKLKRWWSKSKFIELCKRNNLQIMPSVLAKLDTSEYNAIGDYLWYKANPKDLAPGKINDTPAILIQLGYSRRTFNFQILWEKRKDE